MKKLIIIPAYNEYENLARTINDVKAHAPDYDYVIIDDCSTDGTAQLCREQGFSMIHLPVNLGIGGAVQTGYLYARERNYDIAVQIDGDGQHNTRYLKDMEKIMVSCGADMVIGSRFIKREGFQSSNLRQMGIRYFSWLIRGADRRQNHRPHIRHADGEPGTDPAFCVRVSEGLPRTRECSVDSEKT